MASGVLSAWVGLLFWTMLGWVLRSSTLEPWWSRVLHSNIVLQPWTVSIASSVSGFNVGTDLSKLPIEINLISVYLAYPDRPIHSDSARSLHHRHILRQEPSTPLQRCSAYEGVCLPVIYCWGHMYRSRELRQLAPPLKELLDRMPSRGW